MAEKFNPGDHVFIVLRDESEEPDAVVGYNFLTCVNGVVLAAPGVNGHKDLDYIMAYLVAVSYDDDELPLVAAHIDDCYPTRKAAEEAMNYELEN